MHGSRLSRSWVYLLQAVITAAQVLSGGFAEAFHILLTGKTKGVPLKP